LLAPRGARGEPRADHKGRARPGEDGGAVCGPTAGPFLVEEAPAAEAAAPVTEDEQVPAEAAAETERQSDA
ncbi:MAG: hypothetical protein IBJ13_04585, partial [Sphingopyxis sp.]|nr:hypothetical protein [Sphingopyxis sp.]